MDEWVHWLWVGNGTVGLGCLLGFTWLREELTKVYG